MDPIKKEALMKGWNSRLFKAGMTLFNANGDVDVTSFGFQQAMDRLTYIRKETVEQKFYEVAPADYIPVSVGEGAFSQSMLTNLTFMAGGDFEQGWINEGVGNDRLAVAGASVAPVTIKIKNWAKSVGYTIFEIEQALRANSWDYVEALHRARKKEWDLGVQMVAFIGSLSDPNITGLYTLGNVNSDVSTITKTISSMSTSEFSTFVSLVLESYRSNCARTAYPTHFIIPEDDWNGLTAPLNTTYPTVSKLEYLKKAFGEAGLGEMKLLPSAYGMPTYNTSRSVNKHRYVMYRYDVDSLRLDIPVDFTPTQPNTWNNFQFQDVAYGQLGGVNSYRPLECEYFDF